MTDEMKVIPDHDLLITVSVKLDQLSDDIKDIRLDLVSRIAKMETRLDENDKFHAQFDIKRNMEIMNWVENFRGNIKLMMIFSGLLFGAIGAIVERLIQVWFKF